MHIETLCFSLLMIFLLEVTMLCVEYNEKALDHPYLLRRQMINKTIIISCRTPTVTIPYSRRFVLSVELFSDPHEAFVMDGFFVVGRLTVLVGNLVVD